MRAQLLRVWETLRSSYWFIPLLMALGGGLLAIAAIALDATIRDQRLPGLGWIYLMGASGARALLSTVAGSAITVAGVVFSITIVALSMASGQYGPRLIRTFTRQGWSQVTLGVFIGTYIYSLAVLSTVPGSDNDVTLPHLSVAIGLALGVLDFVVLIYFIHKVTVFVQAPQIIENVAHGLRRTIEQLFPDRGGSVEPEETIEALLPDDFDAVARPVHAAESGYLQTVDEEGLLELAVEHGQLVRLKVRPGDFVTRGQVVAELYPATHIPVELPGRVADALLTGPTRLPNSDPGFALEQLVEMALRALSPGINDPKTAITVLDWIGDVLCYLSTRAIPSVVTRDDEGNPRLLLTAPTYRALVDTAFEQIRQYGRSDLAVARHELTVIARVLDCDPPPAFREALLHQARLIHTDRNALSNPLDAERIDARYRELRRDFAAR